MIKSLSSFAFLFLVFSSQSYAQQQKIGHVDQQFIFESLPEFKKLNQEIVVKSEQYDKILKEKYTELEAKSGAFEKLIAAKADQTILKDKAGELENLKKSFEAFQENSSIELRNYYGKKLEPIKKKVNDAIIFAGRKNSYSFILRMDLNPDGGDIWPVVLYAQDSTSTLTADILKNLGVDSTAASTRTIGLPQMIKR